MATFYTKLLDDNVLWTTLNWYQNSDCTIPATGSPSSSDDVVILCYNTIQRSINLLNNNIIINNLTIEGFRNTIDIGNQNSKLLLYSSQNQGSLTVSNNIILNNSYLFIISSLPIINNNQTNLHGYSAIAQSAQSGISTFNIINLYDSSQILSLYNITVFNIIVNNNASISYINLSSNDSIIENIIFNNQSTYIALYSSSGSIGNIIFNNNSAMINVNYLNPQLSLDGDVTLTNSIYNYDNSFPLIKANVGGSITFNSPTPVQFILNNDNSWNLDSSVWVFSSSSPPSWTFNDTSSLNGGNLVGNATFNDSSYQTGNSTVSNNSTITFNENSYQPGNITNGLKVYNGFTGLNNSGFFVNGQKVTYIGIPVTVSNSAIFNNNSIFNGTLNGNASFNNNSFNIGQINGNASFNNNSSNYNINNINQAGYVTGNITCNTTATYCPYPPRTLYFSGYSDWNNLNNWWVDSGITIQALFLPTSIDSVIATNAISSNTSNSEPTIKNLTGDNYNYYGGLGINLTVSGSGVFNNNFGLESGSTLTGSGIFNNSTNKGTVLGNATFNNSYNDGNIGTQYQPYTVVFNNGSINGNGATGYIYGNVTLNSNSNNGGNYGGYIYGDAIFNTDCSNGGLNEGGVISGNTVVFNKNSTNSTLNTNFATSSITANTITFNDTSSNLASIVGNVVFNHNSYMEDPGDISGNATFNNESSNRTNISGSVTLNPDRGINGSSILGLV